MDIFDKNNEIFDDNIKNLILSKILEGLILYAPDGSIRSYNPSALKLLGITGLRILDKNNRENDHKPIKKDGSFIDPQDFPSTIALNQQKTVSDVIMGIPLSVNNLKWIRLQAFPVSIKEQPYAIVTFHDVTIELSNVLDRNNLITGLNNHVIVARTNSKGVITYVNNKFCEISGYTKGELIGKTHKLINSGFHPKDFFKELWSKINNGKVWHGEIKNKKKDGQLYWVDTTITPILDFKGNIKEFMAVRNDITQIKMEQEKRLKELDDILSHTPSCLKVIDNQGRLIQMNRQGLDLIEADSMDEVKYANVYDLVIDEHRDGFIRFNNQICSGEKGTHIFKIIGLKGTVRWMETYAAPYTMANGELAHIAITNDITKKIEEIKELEKQNAYNLHNLKLASIGELAAGVGHEINNPLAIAKGYIESLNHILEKGKDLDIVQTHNKFKKVLISLNRIGQIVQGLRTFARADSDKFSNFSPSMALLETYGLISEIFKTKGVKVELNIKSNLDNCQVYGSIGMFQQIIMNLLTNARDALTQVPDPLIQIKAQRIKKNLQIKIIDNGQGIPDSIKTQIFDPFFTTKDINKGTGIGLSMVKNYTLEMDGEIAVHNNKDNKGAIFTLTFPIKTYQSKNDTNDKSNDFTQLKFPIKILLVDDEKGIREVLCETLTNKGADVTLASNVKDAFKLLESHFFDLIISDVQMPGQDGITFLRKLRANKNIPQPKFIFITGGVNLDFDNFKDQILNQFDGYIYKPFNDQNISMILYSCFGKK